MQGQFLEIEVERREVLGKKSRRDSGERGLIPAVVYGGGKEPVPISVDPKKIIGILRSPKGANSVLLFSLQGTAAKRHVMIKDFQIEPVTNTLIHADFKRIGIDEKVRVKVPLEFSGLPVGVKTEGGMVDVIHREVLVECLPLDIPAKIHVDIGPLHLNEGVTIGSLAVDEKVHVVAEDRNQPVVHVVMARVAAVEAAPAEAVAAEEPAEPEVITKGKKPAEGEEAAEKPKEKAKK